MSICDREREKEGKKGERELGYIQIKMSVSCLLGAAVMVHEYSDILPWAFCLLLPCWHKHVSASVCLFLCVHSYVEVQS